MSTSTLERSALLKSGRTIVEAANAQNRDLNDAEAAEVEAVIAKVRALDAKPKGISYLDQIAAISRVPDGQVNDGGLGGGEFFTPEAKSGLLAAIKSRQSFRAELPAKAALTSSTMLPTVGEAVVPGLHPTSQFALANLFNNVVGAGPTVRYYRMTSGTAAVVAEGALKPDAGVSITPVDLALVKIATRAQYTSEMSEDAPYLVTYLQQELQSAVLAAENASILSTFNATSGVLTGTSTAATVIDLLADAIASAEALSGITPAAVVTTPAILATIRKAKASTAGSYLVDVLTAGPTMLHGVMVVSSPSVAAGIAWLIDPAGVVIYRRGGLSVSVGTDGSDFSMNLSTIIAEERVGTAVLRPSSLTKLTLT